MSAPSLRTRVIRQAVQVETVIGVLQTSVLSRRLDRRNRTSSESVTGDAPVVVSLTSYGHRIDSVHLTIEAIGSGQVKPRRLILWVDDEKRFAQLPEPLRRLQDRGLEVKLTENLGPYTKFYPTLAELGPDDLLVTADDDLLYSRTWLARLLEAHRAEPHYVHCYRARDIVLDGDGFAPYSRWRLTTTRDPGFHRFGTGVSGIIYPRRMIEALTAAGDAFRETAPRADDIWLHFIAVTAGVRIRQLSSFPRHFPLVPGSQKVTLYSDNLRQGQNDPQIQATYTPEAIAAIRADIEASPTR